jgi:hypothetical protein
MATDPVTRYDVMPIPPVDTRTEYLDAGAVVFGVEYRLLTDAIAARARLESAGGGETGSRENLDDRGVSIHVFGVADGERREHLRFDCFDENPHYHYISWSDRFNHMVHLDPVADGDPVAWALERIRNRLPQMLARAGAPDVAAKLDATALEQVLPRLTEAVYRARYHSDETDVLRDALDPAGKP